MLYLLARAGAGIIFLLPRPAALALARFLGGSAYWLVARQRDKTLDNLRKAYHGKKSEAEIRELARKVFGHVTVTAVEMLQFPKWNWEKVAELVDASDAFKLYDSLLKEGKGIISITAHIGNWELLAGVFGLKGYQGIVLARKIYYEPYNRWIVGLRQALKVPTVYRDEASREILKRLAQNQIVGILPDQDIDSLKGEFVNFFGRPAYTPVAPIRLALASGAPIVPNFLIRQSGDRYKMILGQVIRPVVGASREEAVKKYTEEWMAQFEKVIQEYPEQWGWMHNRWKTKPPIIQKGPQKGNGNLILS